MSITPDTISEGTYSLTAEASDSAGNTASKLTILAAAVAVIVAAVLRFWDTPVTMWAAVRLVLFVGLLLLRFGFDS